MTRDERSKQAARQAIGSGCKLSEAAAKHQVTVADVRRAERKLRRGQR